MTFQEKLGRTVSYAVLISGVVLAANASAADPANLTSIEALQAAAYDADGQSTITGWTDTVNVEGVNGALSQGYIEASELLIKGSNLTISGQGTFLSGKANTTVDADSNVTLTSGGHLLADNADAGAGVNNKLNINGTVNLKDGGIIRAASDRTNAAQTQDGFDSVAQAAPANYAAVEIAKGANVNVSGDNNIIASRKTNMSGVMNIASNAVLNLVGDLAKNLDPFGTLKTDLSNTDDAGVAASLASEGKFNVNADGVLNNNGTINANAVAIAVNGSSEAADNETASNGQAGTAGNGGVYNANNSTLNGDLTLTGAFTDASNLKNYTQAEIDAVLAAAPKANFSGKNTIAGDLTNTMGLVTVNQGAELTADGITNNGYLDVAGKVDAAVTGSGNITVKGSDANFKSIAGNNLEIAASTSLSKLLNEDSSATQVYVSNGAEFTIDDFGADNAGTFTTNDLVSYGSVKLDKDFSSNKVKAGRGGSIDLGSNTLTSSDIAFWDGSSLGLNIDKVNGEDGTGQEGGSIAGDVKVNGQVNLNTVIALDAGVTEAGNTYKFADSVAEYDAAGGEFVNFNNNTLYDTAHDNGTLTIKKKGSAAVAESVMAAGGSANDANVVNAWVGGSSDAAALTGASAEMANHLNTLAQTNPRGLTEAATALAPETTPVITTQVTENNRQIFNVAGGRLDSSSAGMSSGENPFKKAGLWIQGLFNKSKLDKRSGFDADTYGTAVGADGYVNDNVKVGLGYAFTNSDIDSTGRKTDVNTNTGFVYGEYNTNQYYVNAVATYSNGAYKEKKNVAGMRVNASYDVDSIGLQTMAGYKMGNFTPEAGLRYINTKQDSYTDTSGQRVGSDSTDTLTAILGGKYGVDMKAAGYNIRPEVKLAATYDLMRDKNRSVVSLANGSNYLVEGENLKRFGIEAGAKLNVDVTDQVKIGLGYEGRFKKDYTDHTGLLEARYNF